MGKRTLILGTLTLVSIMLVMASLPPSVLWAQEETLTIKSMRISLWPEYDDPRILVMYEGEFADGSLFPHEVKFPAPVGAEIEQVCALQKPSNQHQCQLYQAYEEDGALAISYTLPITTYFLEYYYDGLEGQTDKAFTYEFQSPYRIQKLEIEVQQPLRSASFSLSPDGATPVSRGDGFQYYGYSFDDVTPGQVISIGASYTKSDDRPSVSGASGEQGGGSTGLIVGGITAVVALAVVGWLAFLRPRGRRVSVAARSGKGPRAVMPEPRGPSHKRGAQKASFCSHCGLKLDEDDNFCPKCGTSIGRRS